MKGKDIMAHDADYSQMAFLKDKYEQGRMETTRLELRHLSDTVQRLEGTVDTLRRELLTIRKEISMELKRQQEPGY